VINQSSREYAVKVKKETKANWEESSMCLLQRIFKSYKKRKSSRHVINVSSSQSKPTWSPRNKWEKRKARHGFFPLVLVLAHDQGSRDILGPCGWTEVTHTLPLPTPTFPSPISITIGFW
jgi:hypothetical protein